MCFVNHPNVTLRLALFRRFRSGFGDLFVSLIASRRQRTPDEEQKKQRQHGDENDRLAGNFGRGRIWTHYFTFALNLEFGTNKEVPSRPK